MKKLISLTLALIMALTLFPLNAYAADYKATFFPNGKITTPKAPYIQYINDPAKKEDSITFHWEQAPEFVAIAKEFLKDQAAFRSKYNVDGMYYFPQIDVKIDDGNWHYTSAWDAANPWDSEKLLTENYYLFNFPSSDFYESEDEVCHVVYSGSGYDFKNPANNGIFKDYVKTTNDGTKITSAALDMNHTYTFRFRFVLVYTTGGKQQILYSGWSDTASIGKNGTQNYGRLTEIKKPAATESVKIKSAVPTGTSGGGHSFELDVSIPQSIFNKDQYYVITQNTDTPIEIQTQYRVNGGGWKTTTIANPRWLIEGKRPIAKITGLKDGDKVEFRMRAAEGEKKDTYTEWSNIVPAKASSKAAPSTSEKPITVLAEGASEKQVDSFVTTLKNENDPKGSDFSKFPAQQAKVKKNSIKIRWTKVAGAKYYIVYGNKCGKANSYVRIAKVTANNFTQKKLKKGTYYKYVVSAFDANGKHIATSPTMHIATKGGKVCNFKKVTTKAKKNKVVLAKKGKSFKLKAKAVKDGKKAKTHRKVRYVSSNPAVAAVNAKGVIKAKKKGSCVVYAYAQNGVNAKIKVTVKK